MDMVSYASGSPDIRVTAVLYVPDGDGPFPAVVNLHDLPDSAIAYYRATEGSMVTMIPGLLAWGDLDQMRQLAQF